MKTTFVSTSSLSSTLRGTVLKAQQKLVDANKEMTTSRFADVGLSIGSRTGQTVGIRNEHARLESIIDTNGLVSSGLDVSQKALDGLLTTAQNFLRTLIGVRSGEKGADVLVTEAKNNLQSTIATANTYTDGQYIFAGINTQQKPMTDYFAQPAAANKTTADTAFTAFFGFNQSAPAVADISAADMKTFLQTSFSTSFADPAWGASWSSAADKNATSRISTNEVVEVSTNANTTAFRELAKVYAMALDVGTKGLNQNAFQAVVDEAVSVVNKAIGGLVSSQAQLGSAQARVKAASDRLTIQRDIMAKRVGTLEGVDPYEAKTRVDQLKTQIETSYSLTVGMQSLSILKYMR